MAPSSPLVSVIVPVFNGQSTISDAVTSVLSQDFQQAETIVTNDGSTDQTASILAGFGSAIRVIDQSHRGVSAARNSAARAARGEYLAFLDADDVWLAGKLARTVAALEKNPSAVLVFSDYIRILDSGLPGESSQIGRAPSMHDLLSRGWSILPSTVVMKKSAYERCGGCSEKLLRLEDSYLWLLARELGEFVYVAEPLVRYRETSIARLAGKYESGRLSLFRLLNERYGSCAAPLINDISGYFASLLVAKALEEMGRGKRIAALRDAVRALTVSPGYIFRPEVRARILRRKSLHRLEQFFRSRR